MKVSISQISNQQNATSQISSVTQTSASGTLSAVTQSASTQSAGAHQPVGMAGIAGVLGVNPAPNQPAAISTSSISTSSVSTQNAGAAGNPAQATSSPAIVPGSGPGIPSNLPVVIASGQQNNSSYTPGGYYPPPPAGYYPPPPGYYPPPPGYYPPQNYYPQASSGGAQSIPDSRQGNISVMQPGAYPAIAQQSLPQSASGYPAPVYYPPPGYYPPSYAGAQQQGAPLQNYPSYPASGSNYAQPGYQGMSQVTESPNAPALNGPAQSSSQAVLTSNPASSSAVPAQAPVAITTFSVVGPESTSSSLTSSSSPVVDKLTNLLSDKAL